MKKIFCSLFILLAAHYSYANISLPKIFGDNMVLQRTKLIPVWGWAGNTITLSFKNIGSGLMAKSEDGNLSGFEIAGIDKIFYAAKALIKNNKVVVSCNSVRHPIAVRFGWADDAGDDNLFNKEGFPAAPFRTDKWKGITEGTKFEFK